MSTKTDPKWRANSLSFIGHSLTQEGDEVFYTPPAGGEVAENLSPLNDAAQAIVDAQKGEHPDKSPPAAAPEPEAAPKPRAPRAAKPAPAPAGAAPEPKPPGDDDVA